MKRSTRDRCSEGLTPDERPDEPRRAGDPWTAKSVAAAAFFVLCLSIQAGVPLVRLWEPRPARFGWQMFSATHRPLRFSLVMRDGSNKPVELGRFVGNSRGEVNLAQALPPHLCRVVPDVAAVQVIGPDSKEPRVYRCP